jgi:chromate transporter
MQLPIARPIEHASNEYSLSRMVRYFLWLGTIGFGGPIALAAYMQRDLVGSASG